MMKIYRGVFLWKLFCRNPHLEWDKKRRENRLHCIKEKGDQGGVYHLFRYSIRNQFWNGYFYYMADRPVL